MNEWMLFFFCDTCVIDRNHEFCLSLSFIDVCRCPSRVSADGSLHEFSYELFNSFGQWKLIQFIRILCSLYAVITDILHNCA